MRLRYLSDTHLEFSNFTMENPEPADVLVLAGDVTVKNRVDWVNEQASRFTHVVYVYGNHEFYGSNFDSVKRHTRERLAENVHVLDNSTVTLDGVTFHGGTLWTDYNRGDPMTYHRAFAMNDYKKVRDEKYRKVTPQGLHKEHNLTKLYLLDNVKEGDVVVTHHAPTFMSVHENYRGDLLNGCYASDLSELMLDTKPALWFHGHVHNTFDYEVGDTRVLCNPRGYEGHELNPEFDLNAEVEL